MERRQIIKAIIGLPLVPVVLKGEEVAKAIEIEKDSKYIVLIKASSRLAQFQELNNFCNSPYVGLPKGTPILIVDDPEEDIKILKL